MMKKTIVLSVAAFAVAAAYALVPSADELKQAEEWSARVFGGEIKELPFTFAYNGKDFRAGGWTKTKTDSGYVFREPSGAVEAILEIRKYPGFPALSWLLRFKNVSAAKSGVISNVRNFDFLLPAVSKRKHHIVHHAAGAMQSLDDYQQFTTPVTREWWLRPQSHRLHVETTGGRACESAWPYFNVETPDAGQGMIAAIGWAGQWQADFLAQDDGQLKLTAGMNDCRFYLNPGEAVRGPRALVLFYKRSDWLEGQNIWRQWFLECNEPRLDGKIIPYQTMCSARSVGFDSDSWSSATHKEGVDAYAAHGFKIDYWWIDAAWYEWKSQWNKKGGEAHWRWTGNYDTDPVRFPKGPGEVFDYAREKLGAKEGILWFELERVVPSARVYQEHPEYFYAGNTGRGAFLNLGDPKAWEWGFKTVDSVLKREHTDYFRLDFNFPPLHFWRQHDARNGEKNRVGISEMKHVEGFYRLYEAVLASNPSRRRIDNCSQGGCRNDVESLSYSAPLWRTDTSGPLNEQQMQTLGISLWVPLYGGGRPKTVDPYELRSRLMPYLNVGTGLAPASVNWDNLKANYQLWEKIKRYYVKDFYPLTRSDNGSDLWCGWEFVDGEDGSGFIQLFRRENTPTSAFVVKPRGLDPAKMYVFTDVDTAENWTIPGDGSFEIRADKPRTAKVVLFKAAGDKKVSIITDAMREFLKRPKWERMGLMLDQDFRTSAKKAGSRPKPFELKVGDASDVELCVLPGEKSKRTVKVADGIARIDNLLVGTRYAWTARRDGKTVGTGTFETEAEVPRICRIDGVGNVRDIGGHATLDGKRVKQGMLYRSAALNRQAHGRKEQPKSEWRVGESLLTDAAMKETEATFGIRLELDLRTDWESYGMTSSPLGPSTRWVNVSSSNYDGMKNDTAKAAFAKCFRELNNPANLPAIFHCAGGADRTGSLAWLLGGILGVDEDDLDKDWELTVFDYDLVKFNHWNYIDGLKRYLNEAFPKMSVQKQCVAYAKACGITDDEINRFRELMLESHRHDVSFDVSVAGDTVEQIDFGPAAAGGYADFEVVGIDAEASNTVLRIAYACHPDGLSEKGDFWRETSARYLGRDIDLPILPANIDRYELYRLDHLGHFRAKLLQGLVRYARFSLDSKRGRVEVRNFRLVNDKVHSEGERAGWFKCSDERFAQLWEASVRTCELSAIPSYVATHVTPNVVTLPYLADGAKRDRLVWSGDLWFAERSCFYGFRPDAPYMRGSIDMLAANQTPEGYIQACPWPEQPPPGKGEWGPFGSDEFACWFVPVLQDYYLHTADLATVKRHYRKVVALMRYLAKYQREDGIFEQRKDTCKHAAGLVFGGTSLHHRSYMNILLWKTFVDAAYLSDVVGEPEGNEWRAAAEKLAVSVRKSFWENAKGFFVLSEEDTSFGEEANALALAVKFATKDEAARIMPQMKRIAHGKFQQLAARGRFEYGDAKGALAMLEEHGWYKMLDKSWKGTQLTAECMVLRRKGWGDEAHPDTAIASLYTNYILGIVPLEPGFKRFLFNPTACDLVDRASGEVPTPHGPIRAAWWHENGRLVWDVKSPDGTEMRNVVSNES